MSVCSLIHTESRRRVKFHTERIKRWSAEASLRRLFRHAWLIPTHSVNPLYRTPVSFSPKNLLWYGSPHMILNYTARPSVLRAYLTYAHSFAGFRHLGISCYSEHKLIRHRCFDFGHSGTEEACGTFLPVIFFCTHTPQFPWRFTIPCLYGSMPLHSFVTPDQSVETDNV
jgi:hypothetical protein